MLASDPASIFDQIFRRAGIYLTQEFNLKLPF